VAWLNRSDRLRQTKGVLGVLEGFAIIGVVILIGYLVGRFHLLGADPAIIQHVLSRLVFFVLSPCLLFTVLAEANVRDLFSRVLAVSAISAIASMVLFVVIATVVWKRAVPDAVVGAASSSYVNANNIGIPVAVYVLGNPALSAPVLLLQLIVLAPIILTVLDISTSGRASIGRILLGPVRNPLIIASLLGVIVSLTRLAIPTPVIAPFALIGAASVPVVLMTFGMSLHGRKILEAGTDRKDVVLASVFKLLLMPAIAWFVGGFVFGLTGTTLFGCVVLAALPTAQNVLNYAQRYERGVTLARDTVLITTIGAVPVLVAAAALLR
jgi:malonate transporter and related proteins